MRALKELMDLSGRVALITGGAGHIGIAMGEALAELGAGIVVLDLSGEACRRVCERLAGTYGVPVMPLVTDLSVPRAVADAPRAVVSEMGRLDVLINNAALVGTSELEGWGVPLPEQDVDTWRKALEVNLTAPFVLIQAAADALSESGRGSIINIGSIYGMVGPDPGLYKGTGMGNPAAYGAGKGGLIHLTRWFAAALAPKIRVNAISPGGVLRGHTEPFLSRYVARTPMARMASEEDFKGAAAYLASDLSLYVTGQNLAVEGGWTAW